MKCNLTKWLKKKNQFLFFFNCFNHVRLCNHSFWNNSFIHAGLYDDSTALYKYYTNILILFYFSCLDWLMSKWWCMNQCQNDDMDRCQDDTKKHMILEYDIGNMANPKYMTKICLEEEKQNSCSLKTKRRIKSAKRNAKSLSSCIILVGRNRCACSKRRKGC